MKRLGLRVGLVAAVALIAGCKSKASDGAAIDGGSAPVATPAASASAAVAAEKKKAAKAGETPSEKQERQLAQPALAKGRGLVAKKDYEAAIVAYDEAVKHAPRDAAAIGERGYVHYLAGDDPAAERDLVDARALGATPKVAAQIWYNLGLVRARRGDGDGARAAFATAQSIAPSAAAAKKLEGLSTCTAELGDGDVDLKKVDGFPEAASYMQIDPAVEADAGAKGAVCIHSYTADGSGDDHDVCNDPPPWLVSHDHLMFFQHADILFPAKSPAGSLFIDDVGQQGDWPAHCTGAIDYTAKIDGNFGWVTSIVNNAGGVMIEHGGDIKGAEGLVDMGDFYCANGIGSFDDAFYDLTTGASLFHVHRPIAINATAPIATVAFKNGVVTIGGPGCNQAVDLKLGSFKTDGGK